MLRRTPCIGICSTTYGDLVCRGCKRFAHEIVQWNAYDQPQRDAVWQRLLALRAGAVRTVLQIRDERRLREQARRAGLAAAEEATSGSPGLENLLYDLLHRLQWRDPDPGLDALGLVLAEEPGPPREAALQSLLGRIDREFYLRSVAQYERNFRIPAQ